MGGVDPCAVAVLCTEPAFKSAPVTLYVAVHVVDPPAAKLDTGHETADIEPEPVNESSETVKLLIVNGPVFVTKKLYVTRSPAAEYVTGEADFTKDNEPEAVDVTVASD